MRRRDFCKLIASAAASAAVPAIGQTSDAAQPLNGFDTITGDYAQFCATPADAKSVLCAGGRQVCKGKARRKKLEANCLGQGARVARPWRFVGWRADELADLRV